MSTQISLQLSDTIMETAKKYVQKHGFDSLQDFIRETVREKLFDGEVLSGNLTALASQEALAKTWLSDDEEKSWSHLQKEK